MEEKETKGPQEHAAEDSAAQIEEEAAAQPGEPGQDAEATTEIKQDEALEKPEDAEDFKSKYLYLAAELENQKKRFHKEREYLAKFSNERILSELIEVIDNLERTVAAIEKDEDEKVKNIVKGIDMVKKQLLDTLACHGLTVQESLGKDFDPNFHEAMAQEESDLESNKIISVFEQGYKLNGRLLRAAKVVVAKKNSPII